MKKNCAASLRKRRLRDGKGKEKKKGPRKKKGFRTNRALAEPPRWFSGRPCRLVRAADQMGLTDPNLSWSDDATARVSTVWSIWHLCRHRIEINLKIPCCIKIVPRTPTNSSSPGAKQDARKDAIHHPLRRANARDNAANSNTASLPSSWPRPAASHQLGKLAGALDAVLPPSQPGSSDDSRLRVQTGHVHSKTVAKCQRLHSSSFTTQPCLFLFPTRDIPSHL